MRGNRHEITSKGWIHDQDNAKVKRTTGEEDFVLAKEKGYNTYVKVADEKCKAAADWWKKNYDKGANVRVKWDEVFNRNTDLTLKEKVDNKVLFKHLFDEKITSEEEITTIIESFIVTASEETMAKTK